MYLINEPIKKGRKLVIISITIFIGFLLILDSIEYILRLLEAGFSRVLIDFFIIFIAAAFIINAIFGILLLCSRSIKEFIDFQNSKYGRKNNF